MAITPRLDNLAAMQNRPLGTNTALYRDPSTISMGRQYKQQKSDYDMARRLLRRAARRGDTNAALKMIDLGDKAAASSVEFGMQNTEQRDANIAGRVSDKKQEMADANNLTANLNRPVATGLAAGRTPTAMAGSTNMDEAPSVWNTAPKTQLGTRAFEELGRQGGGNLNFRQGLDRALGMAKTDAERSELQTAAKGAGISDEAFKRRSDWWNQKRKA